MRIESKKERTARLTRHAEAMERSGFTNKQAPSRNIQIPRKQTIARFQRDGRHAKQKLLLPRNRRKDKVVILTAHCVFNTGEFIRHKTFFVEFAPYSNSKETVEKSLKDRARRRYGHQGEISDFKMQLNPPTRPVLVG